MKKQNNFRRRGLTAILAAVCILTSMLTPMTSSAEALMEAESFPIFDAFQKDAELQASPGNDPMGYAIGGSFERNDFSVQLKDSGRGYTVLQLDSDTIKDTSSWSSDTNAFLAAFKTDSYSVTGTTAMMFYVKNSAVNAHFSIQLLTDNSWYMSSPGNGTTTPFFALGKGDTSWKQYTAQWYNMPLPAGFEGWVRIPWSSFMNGGTALDPSIRTINSIALNFSKFGGETYGEVLISEPLLSTNNVMAGSLIKLNGAQTPINLFTGIEFSNGTGYTAVKPTDLFSSVISRYGIEISGANADFIDSGAKGKMFNVDASSHTTTNMTWGGDTGCEYDLVHDSYTDVSGTSGMMFYLKQPETGANDWFEFFVHFTDGWKYLNNGTPIYLLSKDASNWTSVNPQYNRDVPMPADFEGWVKIPWTSFLDIDLGTCSQFDFMRIGFEKFGGDWGAGLIGEPLLYSGDVDTKNIVRYENNGNVVNLHTGEVLSNSPKYATVKKYPLFNVFPKNQEISQTASFWHNGNGLYSIAQGGDISIQLEDTAAGYTVLREGRAAYVGTGWNVSVLEIHSANNGGGGTGVDTYYENIANTDGMMFYVKKPQNQSDFAWMGFRVRISSNQTYTDDSNWAWYECGVNAPIYLMAENSASWTSSIGYGRDINVGAGFEGWVKIPWSSFSNLNLSTVHYLSGVIVEFNGFGDIYGDGLFGEPLIYTGNVTTDLVRYEGNPYPTNLHTGQAAVSSDLSALEVTGCDIGFDAAVTNYNLSVPYIVKSVNVNASAVDSENSIVSGAGQKDLSVGANAVDIKVIAANGESKIYTVTVTRGAAGSLIDDIKDVLLKIEPQSTLEGIYGRDVTVTDLLDVQQFALEEGFGVKKN